MTRRISGEELKEIYRRRTARSAHGREDCPQEEVLHEALSGRMTREARAQLVSHLRACSDCAREYRILRMMAPWADELKAGGTQTAHSAPNISFPLWNGLRQWMETGRLLRGAAVALLVVFAVAAVWLALLLRERENELAQLSRDLQTLEEKSTAPSPRAGAGEPRSGDDPTAIAELRRQIADAGRPELNTPIIDLDPGSVTRGLARVEPTRVAVPRGSSSFALILHISGERSFSDYSLEIRDSAGKEVWRGSGLRPAAENTFTVLLHRRLLPAGGYRLSLFGSDRGARTLIESYRVNVEYE